MNKDTKERINYYRDYLPRMKEKLFGAALMFVISALMMSSATFAWITLSASPQVMSIDTTVAANGNLEIALAKPDGSAPGKSAAGDSSAAEGTPVTRANLTWGNLVNLTDPSYGLSEVTLRPAALKGTTGLLSSPLYGVSYGADGRAEMMTTTDDFAYVYFDGKNFMADLKSEHLGVRAISTVQYVDLDSGNVFSEYKKSVESSANGAKGSYAVLTSHTQSPGKEYVASLQGLIQSYAQSTIDGGLNDMDITEYVPNLYKMMLDLDSTVVEKCGEAYLNMAHMLHYQEMGSIVPFTYTVDTLCSDALANKLPSYIDIKYLKEFAQDRKQLKAYILNGENEDFSDLTTAQKNNNFAYYAYIANNGGKVYWKNLSGAINWLVKIDTCVVDGYPMSSLKSNATKIIGNRSHTAVIKEGALYRTEQRIGQKMSPVISITVDASSFSALIGRQKLDNITVTTSAEDTADNPYRMPYDLQATVNQCGGVVRGNDAKAEDTYAMAIDFWLRTNAGSRGIEPETSTSVGTDGDGNEITTTVIKSAEIPFVTLEGSIKTEEIDVDVKVKDINGAEQPAYTLEGTIDGENVSVDGYMRNGLYYYIDDETGDEVNLSELAAANNVTINAMPKKEKQTVVIGYDGVNRVWTDAQMAEFAGEGTSTTQGGGSCYVFYANSESDQKRFLDLLTAMNVVFIDADGRKIGAAVMDTENYFALNGKVTVPLAVETTADNYLGMDINARDIYGICELEKGVAKRITALVYLNGTKLSNDMVLASGDIQGSLNIQFSSVSASKITTITVDADGNELSSVVSYELGGDSLAIKNDNLMDERVLVSADATVKSFEYDPKNPAVTTVNVTVDGTEPSAVSASFIRAVNSTQGSLQPSFSFTKGGNITRSGDSGDKWTASYTFTKPGTYILRTVWIDGAEYDLSNPVTVEVTGMEITSLTCDALKDDSRSASIFTAATSYAAKINFGFADSKGIPNRVNGIFLDEYGNEVNITMKVGKDGTLWSGNVSFTSSGKYTMKYYKVNGDLYELPESLWITLDIQLGLKVQTWISCSEETLEKLKAENPNASANSFKLGSGEEVTLEISAKIFDNNGNPIDGLGNVDIVYGKQGSAIKKLDSPIKWDAERERYVGSFLVKEAGTYRFARVTVGENSITSYTSAPYIQAMPPQDVSYYSHSTVDYQFAPKKDAEVVLNLAYSSAATKIDATVTNGVVTETVEGSIGGVVENTGADVVNEWYFDIPKTSDGTQEGQWTVKNITLYGVYYDGVYYGDESGGATIDLAFDNIQTKVVNNIHVTLNSQTTSKEFTGYFMDEQKASGNTVTIADYEGEAIRGLSVSDVKVMYSLNHNNISLDTYGYTVDGLEAVNVSAAGTLKSGSVTDYALSDLSFRYAGAYNKCDVSFVYNGKSYTAGTTDGTVIHYRNADSPSDLFPTYEVKWIAPTVKITGTNPAPSSSFNLGDPDATAHNYYEDFYANVYGRKSGTLLGRNTYALPKITLNLTNAGSNISNTNKVTFTIPSHDYPNNKNEVVFTANNTSKETEVGATENSGGSRRYCGNVSISNVTIVYGGKTFTVKLSDTVKIYEGNNPLGSFAYNVGAEYSDIIDVSAEYDKIQTAAKEKGVSVLLKDSGVECNDGRQFSVTLPSATVTKIVSVPVGDSVITYRYTETTQPIKWTTTESDGCNGTKDTNHTGSKITTKKETISTGLMANVERTYKIDKWSIETFSVATGASSGTTQVNPGTVRNVQFTNRQVATPIVSYTDGDQIGDPVSGSTVTDTEETVVWKEGTTTITQPSDWSNNGNATTKTWEADS